MRRLVSQLTYSRVMATLALFIALGGSAYALQRNSVGTRALKPNAVKSKQIKNRSVRGRDVKRRAIGKKQVRLGQLTAAAGTPSGPPSQIDPIECDPEGGLVTCAVVELRTPVAGRVLVNGSGEVIPEGATPVQAIGSCDLALDGKLIAVQAEPGPTSVGARPFALSAVSERVTAGEHRVELRCDEVLPAQGIRAEIYGLTAVLIGGT